MGIVLKNFKLVFSYYEKRQTVLHILLHFLLPLLIAIVFFSKTWKKAWLIFCATMIVDIDHLLANPIYDPLRCSINFHPLHTYWAIAIYCLLLTHNKTRLIGIGLLLHMLLDWQDCYYKLVLF